MRRRRRRLRARRARRRRGRGLPPPPGDLLGLPGRAEPPSSRWSTSCRSAAPHHKAPAGHPPQVMRDVRADDAAARARRRRARAAARPRGPAGSCRARRWRWASAVARGRRRGRRHQLRSSSGPGPACITAQVVGRGSAQLRLAGGHAVAGRAPLRARRRRARSTRSGSSAATSAPAPTKALFSVTAAGDGEVDVPGNLQGVSPVLVTPEPTGGSQHPTHPPVISVSPGLRIRTRDPNGAPYPYPTVSPRY